MKILALTLDAAGNLPPMLGLAEALIARGHTLEIMGHKSQAERIEAAGAAFLPFADAPERDGDLPENAVTLGWLDSFEHAATWDFLSAARRHGAETLIVDALLASALDAAIASRWPVTALCHTLYEVMANHWAGRFRSGLVGADLAVVTHFAAFHDGPPTPANTVFAGPLRPRQGASPWRRRHPDKPLILASLSTGHQDQRPVLERLCAALAEVDAEALVTLGRAMSPDGLARGPLMSLERVVPHEAVLPLADLAVTHAGLGTVMAAAAEGVPMLCLPGGGDQPANAGRVVELGLGERLDVGASPHTLRDAVNRLLADKSLHAHADAFADRVAAEPGPGPALERIEGLAR